MNPNQVFSRVWAAFDACEILVACAWCGRIRLDDTWFNPPVGVIDAIDSRLALSHSICDECAAAYPSTPTPVPTAGREPRPAGAF